MSRAETYRTVDDPIYYATLREAGISNQTAQRESGLITTPNGYGSLASPLNGPSPKQVVFDHAGADCKTMRWNNCALKLTMYFHLTGDTTAQLPQVTAVTNTSSRGMFYNVPAWNMVGSLISSVVLYINETEIYKSTAGHFLEDFTARLLRQYSYETLESMDHTLFTPIYSKRYSAAATTAVTQILAVTNAKGSVRPLDGVGIPVDGDGVTVHDLATVTAANVPEVYAKADVGIVLGVDSIINLARNEAITGYNADLNPYVSDANLRERGKRWATGATQRRAITRIIQFRDLFPTIPDGIIRNMRSFKIDITFSDSLDHLIHTTTLAAGATTLGGATTFQGAVSVTKCELITDVYTPEALKQIQLATEKAGSSSDILPMLIPKVITKNYTSGTDISVGKFENVDSVLMFKIGRGVAGTGLTYSDQGSTMLFTELTSLYAAQGLASADSKTITDVQMELGGYQYPSRPLIVTTDEINTGKSVDPTQLYYEYRKAIGRLNRLDGSPSIPLQYFSTTLPIIWFRPWSDEAPHRSPMNELIVRARGGADATNVTFVVFEYVVFRINADTSVMKM